MAALDSRKATVTVGNAAGTGAEVAGFDIVGGGMTPMFIRIWRLARRLSRRLWVRVALIASLSLFAVWASRLAGGLVTEDLADRVGSEALNRLLNVLATSMLTVTTFSLTVMVTVFRSSSQQFTPRAHRELMKDTTTQTALATFIGAYIYALAGIILSERQGFTKAEQAALYFATILVLALIVLQVLRWMVHLQSLGSLMHATSGIEREAIASIQERQRPPWTRLGPLDKVPPGRMVHAQSTGYLQEISPETLFDRLGKGGGRLHLLIQPGDFVDVGMPLAVVENSDLSDDDVLAILHMGALRTTAQDPRFSLILLSEFGSKALSPGINDPGTAIDCLGRITRILDAHAPAGTEGTPCVFMPALSAEDLVVDGFEQIGRDGAALAEVQLFLQKRLRHLMAHRDPSIAREAAAASARALERALAAMTSEFDRERVRGACPVRE